MFFAFTFNILAHGDTRRHTHQLVITHSVSRVQFIRQGDPVGLFFLSPCVPSNVTFTRSASSVAFFFELRGSLVCR